MLKQVINRSISSVLVLIPILVSANRLMVLMPAKPGEKSDLIPVEELPRMVEKQRKCGIEWIIEYIDGEYPDFEWYYYIPRDIGDTICVWFDPPTPCTLVAISRIWYFGGVSDGTQGTPYKAFAAYTAPGVSLSDFNVYESPGPSPIGEWIVPPTDMVAPDSSFVWDTLLVPNVDVGTNSFVGGYIVGAENQATLSDDESYPTYHSLQFRNSPPGDAEDGWYTHYVDFGIIAFVILYERWDRLEIERLPWSYTTGPRLVRAYARGWCGVPLSGVEWVKLLYNINGGPWEEKLMECIDTVNSVWATYLPGVTIGDSVTYFGVMKIQESTHLDTSATCYYKIISGTPGNIFFYNDDDYYGPPFTPDFVGMIYENVDYWDYNVRGAPDSSVIAFYTPGKGPGAPVILWNSFLHVEVFAEAVGAGLIQSFLDAGGNLFMSGQEFLYGLAGTYDTVTWEAGTFPNEYLKFYKTVGCWHHLRDNSWCTR